MVTDEDYDKNTPLMLAIESGSEDVVEKLISYGSNVNHINKVRALGCPKFPRFLDPLFFVFYLMRESW